MGNQDPQSSATSISGDESPQDLARDAKPPSQTPARSSCSKSWAYLNQPIRPSLFVEMQLLLLTFSVGLQDAISFYDFNCFASNQTGNTVLLVISAVLPEMNGHLFDTPNTGVALGFFLGAAYLTGQIANILSCGRNRLFLVICNLLQTLLVFGAAIMQYTNGVNRANSHTLLAIGMLAAAAGSQVVQSRSFKMTEISTAMATAAWVDLLVDKNLFKRENRARNRRAGFLVTLALGTLVGGFVFKKVGSPAALVISGAGKGLVTLLWLFAEGEREEKGDEEKGQGA
ncbi:hypothetical protein QBC42DRAFT_226381 [Cladorrhinum samala]|uniref:DUF1275 domain protein n=1 Tax=Cladorrhinum samala TaxID=585594 RepID=A0AAV9HPA2_9PEZI|nr:hypothetical protein QBC42DRAFT_226381 [Cladorrhinum samala]